VESVYAYYCLHKFHMLPSQFFALDKYEKAFVMAAIDIRIEREKQEAEKIQNSR